MAAVLKKKGRDYVEKGGVSIYKDRYRELQLQDEEVEIRIKKGKGKFRKGKNDRV